MARRSPPHFFRRATIEEERMFEGVKVSREIHPKFSTLFRRFSFHVYHRCWEFFLLVLFTILLWDSSLLFSFFGLIFLSGIRKGKIVREVTNEISYLLEMKRIWSFGKESLGIIFFFESFDSFFFFLEFKSYSKIREWNLFYPSEMKCI